MVTFMLNYCIFSEGTKSLLCGNKATSCSSVYSQSMFSFHYNVSRVESIFK